jgi:hypothetical protein
VAHFAAMLVGLHAVATTPSPGLLMTYLFAYTLGNSAAGGMGAA